MVLILDGNSEQVSHLPRKNGFIVNKFQFTTAVDRNKCLKQKKLPIFTRAHLFLSYYLIKVLLLIEEKAITYHFAQYFQTFQYFKVGFS